MAYISPRVLVLSCLWSIAFFCPLHFSPCSLFSMLGPARLLPSSGLWLYLRTFSFILLPSYPLYIIYNSVSLLRTTLYFSALWSFILYNTFWPIILLWLDRSNPPTKSSLSTLCFPFTDLITVAAVHLSVKLFDSYWLYQEAISS